MNLTTDTNPGAYAVSVSCIRCGRRRRLADTTIDTDGPSFRAYFCTDTCKPVDASDAANVYSGPKGR